MLLELIFRYNFLLPCWFLKFLSNENYSGISLWTSLNSFNIHTAAVSSVHKKIKGKVQINQF